MNKKKKRKKKETVPNMTGWKYVEGFMQLKK